jgi:hypothetical protein
MENGKIPEPEIPGPKTTFQHKKNRRPGPSKTGSGPPGTTPTKSPVLQGRSLEKVRNVGNIRNSQNMRNSTRRDGAGKATKTMWPAANP